MMKILFKLELPTEIGMCRVKLRTSLTLNTKLIKSTVNNFIDK